MRANMQYVHDGYGQFRLAVKRGLVGAFGNAVVEHKKAIEVAARLLRMKVDVLPALSYQVVSYDGTSYRSTVARNHVLGRSATRRQLAATSF